ncbi:MAG TPA: hypothetical protein VKT77_06625 [Chthonomonadaceae bacterium]|nr:hypothetical protein [Chthonomonadaceae bacterium]
MGRARLLLALTGLFLAVCLGDPCRADEQPGTAAEWAAVLTRRPLTTGPGYAQLVEFVRSDPEVVYGALREAWPKIDGQVDRRCILALLKDGPPPGHSGAGRPEPFAPNPHLLEILALGLDDPSAEIRGLAADTLSGIAVQDVKTRQEYDRWREEIGPGTCAVVMERAIHRAVAAIDSGPDEVRAEAYDRLLRVRFHGGYWLNFTQKSIARGITTGGLYDIRRDLVTRAGMLEILVRDLRPESHPAIRQRALRLTAEFVPDAAALARMEPDIRREAPTLLRRRDALAVYNLLRYIHEPWVTDMLLERVAAIEPTDIPTIGMAADALGLTGDPRGIPSLIALYDIAEPASYLGQTVERSLALLTGAGFKPAADHDGDWWRDWWQDHRGEFPTARDLPYPRLSGVRRPEGFSLRRHAERRSLGAGGEYWLASPGIVAAGSAATRAGLIVAIVPGPLSREACRVWQDRAATALDGRYLVALVQAPSGEKAEQPTVRFSVVVAAAVRDAQGRTPIDRRRVFIVGERETGMEACSCALEPNASFAGCVLLDSPFRTAGLPALGAARGRRFAIVADRSSRNAPYVLSEAGAEILKRHGASVQLIPAAATEVTLLAGLKNAVRWLEGSANPAGMPAQPVSH